jgi:hypothetical protein
MLLLVLNLRGFISLGVVSLSVTSRSVCPSQNMLSSGFVGLAATLVLSGKGEKELIRIGENK